MFAMMLALATMSQPQDPSGLGGKSDTAVVRVPFDAAKWDLVWSEEFSQDGAPNPAHWTYEEGFVRNNEAQFYTKDRRENARVENGKLIIEARLDNWNGNKITSASLTTEGKQSFLYGRIEAWAKIPTGRGTWPAIWTLGENIRQVGWPKCGELDILENVGFDPNRIHANVHVDAYNHTKGNGRGNSLLSEAPWERFHIYAVEWYEDRVEFFFDDQRYLVFRKEKDDDSVWPFDKPQYLILNIAIGGAWGGQQGIDETLFPHRMEVDYVRYYKLRQ
jgi:beta-glucanase (GH16 family)